MLIDKITTNNKVFHNVELEVFDDDNYRYFVIKNTKGKILDKYKISLDTIEYDLDCLVNSVSGKEFNYD